MNYTSCEIATAIDKEKKVNAFTSTAVKYGIFMFVYGLMRPIARLIIKSDFLSCTDNLVVQEFISILFLYLIPLITAILLFKPHFYKRKNTKYIGSEYTKFQALSKFPSAFALSILSNFFIIAIVSFFFHKTQSFTVISGETSASQFTFKYFIYLIITIGILPPIFEEIIFRGFALGALRPYGDRFAIFFSSILFGLIHANIYQFVYASVLGLFMGYIYVRTNSLITTMIYHAIVNCNSVILMFLSTKGLDFVFDKTTGTASEFQGWFFVLMISSVFIVYGTILVGIIQFSKAAFRYIFSKIKKVHTSYLNNEYEYISSLKKYAFLAIQPGLLFCIGVCVYYICINLMS